MLTFTCGLFGCYAARWLGLDIQHGRPLSALCSACATVGFIVAAVCFAIS